VVSKKKLKDYESRVKQSLFVLKQVSEDNTTPRNIRKTAKLAMDTLESTQYTFGIKTSNVISKLDEILQDPNMPAYTRVRLWNVMSMLEAVKD
jgi:uncharacterized protein (UPF0147 family)